MNKGRDIIKRIILFIGKIAVLTLALIILCYLYLTMRFYYVRTGYGEKQIATIIDEERMRYKGEVYSLLGEAGYAYGETECIGENGLDKLYALKNGDNTYLFTFDHSLTKVYSRSDISLESGQLYAVGIDKDIYKLDKEEQKCFEEIVYNNVTKKIDNSLSEWRIKCIDLYYNQDQIGISINFYRFEKDNNMEYGFIEFDHENTYYLVDETQREFLNQFFYSEKKLADGSRDE